MGKSARRRTRRHRRQNKMKIRSRGRFKVKHKLKGGRTGQKWHKRLKGMKHEASKLRVEW